MSHLDCVAERSVRVDVERGAVLHPSRMSPCEGGGLGRVLRQELEEIPEELRLIRERRRELPEQRTELVAETEHARREEVGERFLDSVEPLHVGDVPTALHGEEEVLRR